MVDREALSMGSCQIMIQKVCPWTIVGKVFGDHLCIFQIRKDAVPDLPLRLGVLKHWDPLARGSIFLPKNGWIFAYVVQF
jgi:hypothetical protein